MGGPLGGWRRLCDEGKAGEQGAAWRLCCHPGRGLRVGAQAGALCPGGGAACLASVPPDSSTGPARTLGHGSRAEPGSPGPEQGCLWGPGPRPPAVAPAPVARALMQGGCHHVCTRVHVHRRVGAPVHACTHTCMLGVPGCERVPVCVCGERSSPLPRSPLGRASAGLRPLPSLPRGPAREPLHTPLTGRPRALWPSWVVLGVRWQEGVPRAPGLAATGFRAGLPPMEGVRPEFWKPVFTPI